MNPKLSRLRKKAMALPLLPGVYIMHAKDGEIIYIGKAKALKNRVSQYFGSQNNHAEKVRRMVDNVDSFEYIITDSEFEALILECSLIKQHTPKYNILLKDDKGYSYIRVGAGDWGKLSYVLQKQDDGATYIGPYKSSYYVKSAVEEANKIFRLPTCNRKFPQDFGKARPCLNYHIKQCMAPCTGRVKLSDYRESMEQALDFLKGGSTNSVKQLTEQMEQAAENVANKVLDEDVIAAFSDGTKTCFQVFRFEGGRLFDRESFIVDSGDSDTEEFILRYYTIRPDVPKNVAVDTEWDGMDEVARWLSEKRGNKVSLTAPKRGEQAQLVSMCRSNAAEALAQQKGATVREYSVLEELRQLLGLKNLPEYIESYDISNLASTNMVAGMVVFENGRPCKKYYKRFSIKTVEEQNDYECMKEVLRRRFENYFEKSDEGFSIMPDLILLDGGKGHVNAVAPMLRKMGINCPLFGLVKDSRHRTRAVATGSGEISLSKSRSAFNLATAIQDEVHRYAITYQAKKHRKNAYQLELTKVRGVGEKKAAKLITTFKTKEALKAAGADEIARVAGVNAETAAELKAIIDEM